MLHFLPRKIYVQLQDVLKMKDSMGRTGQTKAVDGSEVAPKVSGWNVLAARLQLNLPASFCFVWILRCWSFAFAS